MKLQQFLALAVGAEVKAFKGQRLIVDKREILDGIEQPCLIDIDTKEPLFGAIYIPHLLGFEGQPSKMDEVEREVGEIIAPATVSAFPVPELVAEQESDIESYDRAGPMYESDNVSLVEITSAMVAEQPTLAQYQGWYEAL